MIPLWLLLLAFFPLDSPPPPAWEQLLVVWSFVSIVTGLALAWSAVGTLLRQAWRASPRERRGLVLPLALLLLIVLLTAGYNWLGTPPPPFLTQLALIPFGGVLVAHPVITALLLGRVSREAHVLGQQAPTYRKFGFVAVAGMVLLLLGGLLFNVSILLSGGIWPNLFLPGTCIGVIIALRMGVQLFRSRVNTQTHPKDASPSDLDSWQEPQGYWD